MAPEGTDVRPGNGLTGAGSDVRGSLRALLAGLVDYAGLFPPARLPLPAAVYNYAHYRTAPYPWILGRFIVPALQMEAFEREAGPLLAPDSASTWPLSLISEDPAHDIQRLETFNRNHARAHFDSIEMKPGSVPEIGAVAARISSAIDLYCEIPLAGEIPSYLDVIGRSGARAKIRCGGTSVEMFPTTVKLAEFLHECHAAGVRFKATAGLHHPVRGVFPLTYEPDSPTGLMHGFLNVFLAAAWVRAGMNPRDTVALLEERSGSAFCFLDDGIAWRDYRLVTADLTSTRCNFALSFGSCSFSEPVAGLRNLGII